MAAIATWPASGFRSGFLSWFTKQEPNHVVKWSNGMLSSHAHGCMVISLSPASLKKLLCLGGDMPEYVKALPSEPEPRSRAARRLAGNVRNPGPVAPQRKTNLCGEQGSSALPKSSKAAPCQEAHARISGGNHRRRSLGALARPHGSPFWSILCFCQDGNL